MRILKTLAIVATIAALGCGGGDDADDGNPTGPPTGGNTNGSMAATINGASWRSIGAVSVSRQPQQNVIGFAGTGQAGSTTYAVSIAISNAVSTGTHNLNIFAGGDGSSLIIGSSAALGWATASQGGSGTLTITTLTANRIAGTFSGTLVPAGHSAGNLVVTGGTFDVTF
jgi:hypothetical protein